MTLQYWIIRRNGLELAMAIENVVCFPRRDDIVRIREKLFRVESLEWDYAANSVHVKVR